MSPLPVPSLSLPGPNEVQVWQLYLPHFQAYCGHWLPWLSSDEQARAQRFYRAQDRDRFILSRGGLRYLLSQYLACPPQSLCFDYSPYGKPSLLQPPAAVSFNLAHSGSWVVYAVSSAPLLGIDVEQANPRTHLEGLIQRCLTAEEQASLAASPCGQLIGFLKYWTIKEAHLKAVGVGLGYPMAKLQVALQPVPRLVCPASIPALPSAPWTVKLWFPAADAVAAVCVNQKHSHISLHSFSSHANT